MNDYFDDILEIPNSYDKIFDNFYFGGIINNTSEFDYVICCTSDVFVKGKEGQINICVPFNDTNKIPNEKYLLDIVSVIIYALNNNKKVYVHCSAGINRSGLISALVLMKLKNFSAKDAIEYLRNIRSQSVLTNDTFYTWLINNSSNFIDKIYV